MTEDEKRQIRSEVLVAIQDCVDLLHTLDDEGDNLDWDWAKDRTEEIGYRLGSIDPPEEED